MYQKDKFLIDWVAVSLVYLGTLLIIPFSDKIAVNLGETTIDKFFNLTVDLIVLAVFASLFIFLLVKKRDRQLQSFIWLITFAVVCTFFLKSVPLSRDRAHFLGYGILSLFLYRALRHSIASYLLYVLAIIFIMLFAFLDESCQLFGLGGRSFSFKDIGVDWFAASLGLSLIALVFRPKLEIINIKLRRITKKFSQLKEFQKLHSKNPEN